MQDEPSLFLSLLPFLIVTLIFFFFAIPISRRKGRGVGFAAWCLIPFVTPFILFYLVSLPDKSVLDRLSALEGKSPKVE
jgi:predicted membrane-bound dolichyl-phosphate-mannose-protein mannosyltransferase